MLMIVSQIVGILAVGLYLLSFQLKKRKHIVWVTCGSSALYVLQYILLGAFSGAVMDVLSTISSYFAAQKSKPRLKRFAKWMAVLTLAPMGVLGVLLAAVQQDWLELLPVAGALLQTGGLWFEKEQTIRKFGLCGAPFWLVYNFISQAYGATFGTVLSMISIVVSMVWYRHTEREGEWV